MRGLNTQQKWILSGVSLTISIIVFTIFLDGYLSKDDLSDDYSIKRVFKYSFTVKNTSNRFIEKANFWVYKPVKLNGSQKLINLDVSHPWVMVADRDGNEKINFSVTNLPPFGNKVFSISAEMGLNDKPNQENEDDIGKYLRPEKYIESDDPKIISIAKTLKADTVMNTVSNTFHWVIDNLTDAGYIERDHGALYALNAKRGDCTEYMNLFLALARSNNIPARGVAGYVYKESAVLKPRDYHNWVVVYIDRTWRVVDPLNKIMFKDESDYIAMRALGSLVDDANNNTQNFFGSDSLIDVSMN